MQDPTGPGEEALLNLSEKTNDELRLLLDRLSAEEDDLSYRRRVLHGRIDILRAELVHRLAEGHRGPRDAISGTDVDKLVAILAGDLRAPKPDEPADDAERDDEE